MNKRSWLSLVFSVVFGVLAWITQAAAQTPSPVCTCPCECPKPTLRTKWHPGHYMFLDGNRTTPELRAAHLKQIDLIANEPTVKGVKLVLYWGAIEKAQGDYSAGFAVIDQYLAKLKATGKYLILSVQDRTFSGYLPAEVDQFFPAYIRTQYGITKMRNGETLRSWLAPVMDRQIAMMKALAARYDSHPNFEMYQIEETAVAVTPGVDGFSLTAYGTQTKRLLSAARPAWTQTLVRLPANFFGSDAQMWDLLTHCTALPVAVGGPDVIPNQTIQADRLFMGGAPGSDLRGIIPWVAEVQSPSLGGHKGTFTPQQLYHNGMLRKPSHFVWYRNTWLGGTAQRWDTGILPFIKSVKGATVATCPSALKNSCVQ